MDYITFSMLTADISSILLSHKNSANNAATVREVTDLFAKFQRRMIAQAALRSRSRRKHNVIFLATW
jgi:hypothetical protein